MEKSFKKHFSYIIAIKYNRLFLVGLVEQMIMLYLRKQI